MKTTAMPQIEALGKIAGDVILSCQRRKDRRYKYSIIHILGSLKQ